MPAGGKRRGVCYEDCGIYRFCQFVCYCVFLIYGLLFCLEEIEHSKHVMFMFEEDLAQGRIWFDAPCVGFFANMQVFGVIGLFFCLGNKKITVCDIPCNNLIFRI